MSSFTTSIHNSNSGSGGGGAGGNSTRSQGGQEPSDNMRMVLHEGPLRVRQGNKWKSRWCVLSLSSPVSDKLRFTFKKEIKRQRDRKAAEYKEKFFFDCVDYCGMIPELRIDSCQHAMCVVFAKKMLTLGFETKYTQTDWECRIRSVYGEENLFTFSVQIPSNSPSGILSRMRSSTNAMMFIFNDNIAFVTMPDDDVPQKLASMKLSSVECYGADPKTRSIMLKLKKKAYRFESHMPEAILKALDHVSGRRLLHESEGSVSEDLRSEMEFADYGQAVSDLFMQPITDLGGGGLSSPGGVGTGGNALSHSNLLYKIATNPPTSGMPTIDVNDCPFDDGTLDINTAVSERTHQYTSPRQSMASQHLQERSMLSLDDKNSLATNTMSSNTSQNAFGATLNNNMVTDFYAASHGDSPTPTHGSYISNTTSATTFNFRQLSPSNTVPNSYIQDPASMQIAVNLGSDSSQQSHCPTDLVPPPVPKRMSALYHKNTSRPSALNSTTVSSHDLSRPPHPAGPLNRTGHQLFAASTPLDNVDTNTDPFVYTDWPPGVGSISVPAPHPFVHRPPPTIPSQPYPQSFPPIKNSTKKSHKQFVTRPSTSNFFCGSCGLRRWISCPDICISSFSCVNSPIDLSFNSARDRDQHNAKSKKSISPLIRGNSSLVQNLKKSACTVSKCRNQQLGNQLSAMNASLCFKHLAFLKLPWVRCNSETDCLALPRISNKIFLGQENHKHSRNSGKHSDRGVVHAEGKSNNNFNSNYNPYSNVANGFSEENVAFSGSGSIEIEDSSLGLDGVSVMISGHSRDSVAAISTPSYDWECRLESSRNSNIKSKPSGAKNKASSRAELKHDAPHKQAFQQRPGTAPNMFANETPNMASFYDTNLSSGSERVSNPNSNNINSSRDKPTTTTSSNATGAKTVTSVHNPFSLQLKHQTTLDPQGNVQNHLYINLDYPHTQPHSIVTSTPTSTEAASRATATTPLSHFTRGEPTTRHDDFGGLIGSGAGPTSQFPHQQHHQSFRSQQVPFNASGVRLSYTDSFLGGSKGQKPPCSVSSWRGGKLENNSTTAAKSNYSQLSNFSNVLSSRNNPSVSAHKNVDNERSKKSSLTDLYQNLEYQPSTSSPPSTTGFKQNGIGGAPFGEILLEGAAQSQKAGIEGQLGQDLFTMTSSSGNRSNARGGGPEDVERRRRRAKADHSKATNAAVNRWIDNAVELSNYSRANSPDTFIATAASISDSRDDVFLTDSEQQLPAAGHNNNNTRHTSNLQSRVPQMNLPPNPPPRQKTHNYHNIDPDLKIKHIHCPDNELMVSNPLQNIHPPDSLGTEGVTSHKNNSPWQNVTPSRKPGGKGGSTKWGAPSPKKVSSTKPPLSASSQGSSRFQNEIALRKSSDTYRSINSSLSQNVSDSGINLGFDDSSGLKPNDSDLSIGPHRDFFTPSDFSSQRDFPSNMQAGATNIFQYSSKGGNGGPPSQSGGGFHQHSSSNAALVALGGIKSPPASGLGSATPPIATSSWSHNISANRRSHSESRKTVSAAGSKGSAATLGLQFSGGAAQGRPLGPSSTNQVVNYSVMDDSWAKLGANHSSSQKSHQVSKAEKALVQYSQVDEQLTKALHEAAIQHETDRNNFSSARRKSSGRSSHLSRHHAINSERHSSISGVNQSRAASAAANASHR